MERLEYWIRTGDELATVINENNDIFVVDYLTQRDDESQVRGFEVGPTQLDAGPSVCYRGLRGCVYTIRQIRKGCR